MLAAPAFAQVEDGDIIVGGTFRVLSDGSSFKNEDGDVFKDPKDVEFSLGPHVHYMFHPHMSVGGTIFFNMYREKEYVYVGGDPDEERVLNDKQTGFGLGPAFRYWWGVGEKKKFGFFAEAGVAFITTKDVDEEYDGFNDEIVINAEGRTNSLAVRAVPGIYYSPSKCCFFEIQFGGFGLWYYHDTFKAEGSDDKSRNSYFEAGGSLDQLFFGDTSIGFNLVF